MSVNGVAVNFDDRIVTPTTPPPLDGSSKKSGGNDIICRPDMPEDALDGRLGEIYQTRMQHFPLSYAWGSLVCGAGALTQRNNRPIRTNINFCAVGPVQTGKSSAIDTAFAVIGLKPPILMEAKFGSAEGLSDALSDSESDPVRLLNVDELNHLLEKSKIDRSSFPSVLNTAFYRDEQDGGSKGHKFKLNCRLSVIGGIVEELFGDSFGLTTTGGLYDRFAFALCPKPYVHLWRPFEGVAENICPVASFVDSDVWEVRDEWIKKYEIAPRVAEIALRFGYICACVDGRHSLRAADLIPSFAFAKYQMKVRRVLEPNPGENADARCACAIRSWLSEYATDGRWVKRRELDRGIHAYRFGPGVFNRCLNNLSFNGEIELGPRGFLLRMLAEGSESAA